MNKKQIHINRISGVNETSSFPFELEEEWLNSKEAAAYLKISLKTLMNLCSNGSIQFYKFGRLNRYKKSELIQLIKPAFEKRRQ